MNQADKTHASGFRGRASAAKPLVVKALSFGVVGLVNSAVDFAVTGSYVMNSQITFAAESGRKLGLKPYVSFALSQVAGFVANTATVYGVSYALETVAGFGVDRAVLAGKLLAVGASFAVNFSLSHFIVFRGRDV